MTEERKPRRVHKRKARTPTLQESNDAFLARLRSAVEAGHESPPIQPAAPDDRVIARTFAPTHVLTRSNCTGF